MASFLSSLYFDENGNIIFGQNNEFISRECYNPRVGFRVQNIQTPFLFTIFILLRFSTLIKTHIN